MHRVLSTGRLICGWCGAQTALLGMHPTLPEIRRAVIDLRTDPTTGTQYLMAEFPDGRQVRHYCLRVPEHRRPAG